jgi:hypothetical protein
MTSPAEAGKARAAQVTGTPDAAAVDQLRAIFTLGTQHEEPGDDETVRKAARLMRAGRKSGTEERSGDSAA